MARLKGSNITKEFVPKVSLVSSTRYPIETLFAVWHNSRNIKSYPVKLLSEITGVYNKTLRIYDEFTDKGIDELLRVSKEIHISYPEYNISSEEEIVIEDYISHAGYIITEVAKLCVKCDVPASESVSFTFVIDDASVAFREQLVRSKFASYWTTTSRTADLTAMDVNMDSKIADNPVAKKVYEDTINQIRLAYSKLSELGIPTEDIRLSPECRVHRVDWIINLRALKPILSKRCDWLAQSTLWSPVVSQVLEILESIGISSEVLGVKPPVEYDTDLKLITYHKYDNENADRYYGKDPQPVDPLWLCNKGYYMKEDTDIEWYDRMKAVYIKLWNKDICDILGWDKNNPTKIGKYDRPISYYKTKETYSNLGKCIG